MRSIRSIKLFALILPFNELPILGLNVGIILLLLIMLNEFARKHTKNQTNITLNFYLSEYWLLIFLMGYLILRSFLNPSPNHIISNSILRQLVYYLVMFYWIFRLFAIHSSDIFEIFRRYYIVGIILFLIFGSLVSDDTFKAGRLSLFGYNPNSLAQYLLFAIFLLMQKLGASKLDYLYLIIFLGALFNTGSRGGLILVFLGILSFLPLIIASGKFRLEFIIVSMLLILPTKKIYDSSSVFNRLNTETDLFDNEERAIIWDVALDLAKEKPLLGSGFYKYESAMVNTFGRYRSPHSEVIAIYVYGGLIAVVILFSYLFKILFFAVKFKDFISLQIVMIILMSMIKSGGALVSFNLWFLLAYLSVTRLRSLGKVL